MYAKAQTPESDSFREICEAYLKEHASDLASQLRLLARDKREEALSKHLLLLLWICCSQHGSCELAAFLAWHHSRWHWSTT